MVMSWGVSDTVHLSVNNDSERVSVGRERSCGMDFM